MRFDREFVFGLVPAITAVATVVMAATGIFGYFLLEAELSAFRLQNAQTERAIAETYRPLGVARFAHEEPNKMEFDMGPGTTKDKFFLGYKLNLRNAGQGLLIYVGSFGYASDTAIDFRDAFLKGLIDSVVFDGYYDYARRCPVLENEDTPVKVYFQDLTFSSQYFLYTVMLYSDQEGGLFDTEHLDVFRFKVPTWQDTSQGPTFVEKGSTSRDIYHRYSEDERAQLVSRLEALNTPMASHVERLH